KPILGAALTMTARGPSSEVRHPIVASGADTIFKLPVLVENSAGYRNLCRLVTAMKLRSPKGEGVLSLDELDGSTSGLVALAGRTMLSGRHYGVGGLVDRLVGLFGHANVYVELQ